MSSSVSSNVLSAFAGHLQTVHSQTATQEELLFRKAFEQVKIQRTRKGPLPELLDNLNHAQTIKDVQYAVDLERRRNGLWSEKLGKSWMEKFEKLVEHIWLYKGFLDAVVSRSANVAAPIWGAIAFGLSVFKDLAGTRILLKNLETRLEHSIRRFADYCHYATKDATLLQDMLVKYYGEVIDFAIGVLEEFSHGRIMSFTRTIHRTLKSKLEEFRDSINLIIRDVDEAFNLAGFQRIEQVINSKSANLATAMASNSSSKNGPLVFGVPQSWSHAFTGQQQYLRSIDDALHIRGQHMGRQAIHGIGGIGKTQILLQYVRLRLPGSGHAQAYDKVIWFNASSYAAIVSSVVSLMQLVEPAVAQFTGDNKDFDFNQFQLWLQKASNWLLVLDDVRDYDDVRKALPANCKGHTLCSTRHLYVARQIVPDGQPLEITAMDHDTSTQLVSALSKGFAYLPDNDVFIAGKTAAFSGGIPLLIEQVVHNAIFGKRSLLETLDLVNRNTKLLEQQNISSLHDENLSIGGIVMQYFHDLKTISPKAEALFMLLAYLEPSSIPLSMVRSGAAQFQTFLDSDHTYIRGRLRMENRDSREVKEVSSSADGSSFLDIDPFRPKTWRRKSKTRHQPKTEVQDDLPLDDLALKNKLRTECGPSTPVGRLFENAAMIEDATIVLKEANLIRQIGNDTLWMHDVISDVTKALVTKRSETANQEMALTAATMVYLAFPTPDMSALRHVTVRCWLYLSHAIACHYNLKDAGTLNDCSIGPELSHIIASTLCMAQAGTFDAKGRATVHSTVEEGENLSQIIYFYQQAFAGYMAGWKRLKQMPGIDDNRIFHFSRLDREREMANQYLRSRYSIGLERFGRSAPWRAMQTAVKLSLLLEREGLDLREAIYLSNAAASFNSLAFGPNDEDTLGIRTIQHDQLCGANRWQEAYDKNLEAIKLFIGWEPGNDKHNSKISYMSLADTSVGATLANQAGITCIELSVDITSPDPNEAAQARLKARQAVTWFKVVLKYAETTNGEDHYTCVKPMRYLAQSYERLGEVHDALFWYASAVLCCLSVLVWEGVDFEYWENDPGVGAVLGSEEVIERTVRDFEDAKKRLVQADVIGDAVYAQLRDDKLLGRVESMIRRWKNDREKNGAFDPYQHDDDGLVLDGVEVEEMRQQLELDSDKENRGVVVEVLQTEECPKSELELAEHICMAQEA